MNGGATVLVPGTDRWATETLIPERPLLVAWGGAQASLTAIPEDHKFSSDPKDIVSVTVGGLRNYLGLTPNHKDPRIIGLNAWRSTLVELRSFIRLAYKGDPTALSTLFLPSESYIFSTREGRALIAARDLFISKKAVQGFGDAALDALSQFHTIPSLGWNLDKKRECFALFGYNVDAAATCLRMLVMGQELAAERTLSPDRRTQKNDAELYINVKEGKWPAAAITDLIGTMNSQFQKAVTLTRLPEVPSFLAIQDLLIDLLSTAVGADVALRCTQVGWKEEQVRLGKLGIDLNPEGMPV